MKYYLCRITDNKLHRITGNAITDDGFVGDSVIEAIKRVLDDIKVVIGKKGDISQLLLHFFPIISFKSRFFNYIFHNPSARDRIKTFILFRTRKNVYLIRIIITFDNIMDLHYRTCDG